MNYTLKDLADVSAANLKDLAKATRGSREYDQLVQLQVAVQQEQRQLRAGIANLVPRHE